MDEILPCGDPANPVGTPPTPWGPHQPNGDPANPLVASWGLHQPHGSTRSEWWDPTQWQPCWPHGDPANPLGTPSTLQGPCQPCEEPANPVATPWLDTANHAARQDPDYEIRTMRSYPVEILLTPWRPCQPHGDPANLVNPLGTLTTPWGPCQPCGDPANPLVTPPTTWLDEIRMTRSYPVATLLSQWWPCQPCGDPINPVPTQQPISAWIELRLFNLSQKADDKELKKSCWTCLMIHHEIPSVTFFRYYSEDTWGDFLWRFIGRFLVWTSLEIQWKVIIMCALTGDQCD